MSAWRASLAVLGLTLVAAAGRAQGEGAQLLKVVGPEPAIVRLGETTRIELQTDVRGARPDRPEIPAVEGLSIRLIGPSESHSQFFDGRRVVRRHTLTYTLLVRPERVGAFVIPSIRVPVGDRVEETGALRFEVVADVRGEDRGFVVSTLSADRVYVHQPVDIEVEFGIDARLQLVQAGRLNDGRVAYDVELLAPWLDELDGAVTLEPGDLPGEEILLVRDRQAFAARYRGERPHEGQAFHHFLVRRRFLPTRSGELTFGRPTLRYNVATGRQSAPRSIFDMGPALETENLFAYGEARQLEVLPIPEAGRPADYSGAVGDFSLQAAVDRRKLRVGDSLKLTLTIEGRGNNEFLQAPALDDLPGFHHFGKTEKREPDRVVVVHDITPVDASVTAVPAIAWNAFDPSPGVERFVALATEPIPLDVQPAPEGAGLAAGSGAGEAAVVPGVDDIFDVKPLTDGAPAPPPTPPAQGRAALWILLPWPLLLATLLAWRTVARRRADVVGQRARGAAAACRRALGGGAEPGDALVGYVADRLGVEPAAVIAPDLDGRLRAAGLEEALAAEVARTVEAGVAARYGGGGGASADAVRDLVDRLERAPLRRPARGGLATSLLLVAALGGGVSAQQVDEAAARGMAAYRDGDYAAAAEAFAAAAARPDADRRVLYNLGNARYREGRLAEALLAYERARLGMPRDAELLANIALTERRLGLDRGTDSFTASLAALREMLLPGERLALAAALSALAAACLLLGWRRMPLRVLGLVLLVPALGGALEVLWWGPARPPGGVVLQDRAALVAEPRADLDPLARLRRGARVAVLAEADTWCAVRVGDRRGYLPAAAVGVVR